METFVAPIPLVNNPDFGSQRTAALQSLSTVDIDTPIAESIADLARLPYCFTLQSCYGHFLYGPNRGRENLERLSPPVGDTPVDYRIAYVALCVDNSAQGAALLADMKALADIDPNTVQFGCATWFWQRQVNSYVLQVEPERFKDRDSITIEYQEAIELQEVRDALFVELHRLVDERIRLL